MRTMVVRISGKGEIMLTVVFGEENPDVINALMKAILEKFSNITSLYYVINTKHNDTLNDLPFNLFYGKPYIEEEMEGLTFRVGPKSFYQTNSKQAYKLYSVAREMAQLTGNETV